MNQSASNFLTHALKHAEGLAQQGSVSEALQITRELILHPKRSPQLLVLHQRLLQQLGPREELLAFRELLVQDFEFFISLSLQRDRISVAHSLAQQLLSMAEDSIQAWLLQGQVLLAAENRQAAARCFERALQLAEEQLSTQDQTTSESLALLGRVFLHLGDMERSEAFTWRAIELRAASSSVDVLDLPLAERVELFQDLIFTGGPSSQFEVMGRYQFEFLQRQGLQPEHRLLDIGCGSLRAGHWLIPYLQPGHYCGLEPNAVTLRWGQEIILGETLMRERRPRFERNAEFDFSVFEQRFDVLMARSIWTHASKPQIETMLDSFCSSSSEDAVFFASYLPSSDEASDYQGQRWLGKSHDSTVSGLCHHSLSWIQRACTERALQVTEVDEPPRNRQVWLRIQRR